MTPYRDPGGQPSVLICSGLDPSGGAGFIADVRVAQLLATRPIGVITATTVQNTTAVLGSVALAPDTIREQLELVLSDVEVHAVKIGMIGSSEIAVAIAAALALTNAPVVWDPITYPSRGDIAFVDSLFGRALAALAPHVTVLTPNARELAFLVGRPIEGVPEGVAAGMSLAQRLGTAVLVKGGHLGSDDSTDTLCRADGPITLRGPRIARGEEVHGTGCALSTAIAAHLARGADLVEACRAAKAFVAERIANAVHPGRGAAAIV
ncbi:MAG: bifunctional hydroxymethylpyrimidine kinase/phosphomethylpyrimidine kinase [Kofleriaceae bacterium]